MRRRASLALVAAALCAGAIATPASAKKPTSGLDRPDDPVVTTGAELSRLGGIAPSDLVAFAYRGGHRHKHKNRRWKRIPAQVDERAVVDFGHVPGSNNTPGTNGTVYGTTPVGASVLQYTDPNTFVGADPDPSLDGDDEVALMAADAGKRAPRKARRPRGTKGAGATRLSLGDPLGEGRGFVYLFEARGEAAKDPADDYVDYDFHLTSGDYKTTYDRADGPNPESSRIATDDYQAGFSDRWLYDRLQISAGGASDVDVLDGYKFAFAPGSCGRSELTFSNGEGAFVANRDGPVRAIRAYVGANSGPYTERTNYFYRSEHVIVSDLRVHPINGLFTQTDLAAAGIGMSYLNSANRAGVTVDGSADPVSDSIAAWHLWTGGQGSLFSADRISTSVAAILQQGHGWYLDDSTPPQPQCWGDSQALGQAGLQTTASIPSTDPSRADFTGAFARAKSTEIISPPGAGAADADRLSQQLDQPLSATAGSFRR